MEGVVKRQLWINGCVDGRWDVSPKRRGCEESSYTGGCVSGAKSPEGKRSGLGEAFSSTKQLIRSLLTGKVKRADEFFAV